MHTLVSDFFLTESGGPIFFDVGLKVGEGASWPQIRRAYGPGLKTCLAESYLAAIVQL